MCCQTLWSRLNISSFAALLHFEDAALVLAKFHSKMYYRSFGWHCILVYMYINKVVICLSLLTQSFLTIWVNVAYQVCFFPQTENINHTASIEENEQFFLQVWYRCSQCFSHYLGLFSFSVAVWYQWIFSLFLEPIVALSVLLNLTKKLLSKCFFIIKIYIVLTLWVCRW